ncbi:uncharacterized protein BYT42DRAFT_585834 [Radiomyces spectabilis]|uniref:uncharacterized protein n=1 Tax=Radiomyces spectabilis TaxID=64574 RepID=UPI00221EC883|nr:uncharacterized protein BYT42DRAFT_585834 [Radiomyces spectabilis]KAI8368228.1 hypothetical protein BYT42DRAFT_585834 [Radiomyces spectabilis]
MSLPRIMPFYSQDVHTTPLDTTQGLLPGYSCSSPYVQPITGTSKLEINAVRKDNHRGSLTQHSMVVPSMNAVAAPATLNYFHSTYFHVHPTPPAQQQRQTLLSVPYSFPYYLPHSPVAVSPIHHTLGNATITYDTIAENMQKDLVKDVFFSPAMNHDDDKLSSSFATSSDSESDSVSTPPRSVTEEDLEDLPVTPSDLLLDAEEEDPLFFFGFDLSEEDTVSGQKLDLSPLSSSRLQDHASRCNSVTECYGHKRRRDTDMSTATLKKPRNHDFPASFSDMYDYFNEASGEDTSDEDDEDDKASFTPRPESQCQNYEAVDLLRYDVFGNSTSSGFQSQASFEPLSANETSWEDRYQTLCSDDDEKNQGVEPVEEEEGEEQDEEEVEEEEEQEQVPARATAVPTIYQQLTEANVDWCRYCGTTEGVNWRPGPWGKRTLCNKHGCDYKGYGFACKLPRLDLTGFANESINERDRPVLQLYCSVCHREESWAHNVLVRCEGCPKAVHQKCAQTVLSDVFVAGDEPYFCDSTCRDNIVRKRIVVELPRKHLPLMCAPKNLPAPSVEGTRIRSLRELRS